MTIALYGLALASGASYFGFSPGETQVRLTPFARREMSPRAGLGIYNAAADQRSIWAEWMPRRDRAAADIADNAMLFADPTRLGVFAAAGEKAQSERQAARAPRMANALEPAVEAPVHIPVTPPKPEVPKPEVVVAMLTPEKATPAPLPTPNPFRVGQDGRLAGNPDRNPDKNPDRSPVEKPARTLRASPVEKAAEILREKPVDKPVVEATREKTETTREKTIVARQSREKPARSGARATRLAKAAPEEPGFFQKLFGSPTRAPGAVLAYARTDDDLSSSRQSALPKPSISGGKTAIYDIEAHTVTLPNGKRLEAHSGLGVHLDNPASMHMRMRGVTPVNTYELTLREAPFHGVRALRMTPTNNSKMFGRDGILAHTYMLGPRGDSNGCLVFRNYNEFLSAFLNGDVKRIVVVRKSSSNLARLFGGE